MSPRTYQLLRKLHLWIGAWGAIAAVLFGITGFLQNHRTVMRLPQGESTEVSRVKLPVPEEARASPEALRAWLQKSQHIELDSPRVPQGRGEGRGKSRAEETGNKPMRWTLLKSNARATTLAEYVPGAESLTLRTTVQSPLAMLSRFHKAAGSSIAWILLSDSFALGMVALGISGLLMWARNRTPRQMVFSVISVAVLAILVIGGSAIL